MQAHFAREMQLAEVCFSVAAILPNAPNFSLEAQNVNWFKASFARFVAALEIVALGKSRFALFCQFSIVTICDVKNQSVILCFRIA